MNKKINRFLGKIFILGTAFMWFSCDSESVSCPSSESVPNSSSEPVPNSSSNPIPNSSSDSTTSSSGTSKAFINIEEELSQIKPTDTTGLRGKCIPEREYCETINGWGSHYAAEAHAASIAINKLKDQHKDTPDYWYGNNYCYRTLLGGLGNAPEYGVPECPISGSTPCETNGNGYSLYNEVHIDDAYIEALQRKEEDYYETVKSTLEKINQGMEKCN